ncbi:unnamed protein product [Periconia digitata]|uniref:Uncharacterized protein n=1 Tax=Periconia digitata TaxID=1303443 RepID=A0A9W4U9T0_9PLEO|nr:unnamed protein product [Periconia digitata]
MADIQDPRHSTSTINARPNNHTTRLPPRLAPPKLQIQRTPLRPPLPRPDRPCGIRSPTPRFPAHACHAPAIVWVLLVRGDADCARYAIACDGEDDSRGSACQVRGERWGAERDVDEERCE